MDTRYFDALVRSLGEHGSRRGLLGLLTALPIFGGLAALLDPTGLDAKGRRKRRKKAHKHGKGRDKGKHKKHRKKDKHKKSCTPEPKTTTCQDTCGSVTNNCKQTVDCGPCACDPPCDACEICTGDLVCEQCDPCCNDNCCAQANAVCHADSGACCVPDSKAQTCNGQCGDVVNTCGVTVNCGPCTCDGGCGECHVCDDETGACVADPSQKGNACGEEGQLCQSNGSCACEAGTCPSCTTCAGSGFCEACTGCCDEGHCVAACEQPANPCQERVCLANTCTTQNRPDGTSCSDGDVCTAGAVCTDGVCGGGGPDFCSPPGICCATGPIAGQCGVPTPGAFLTSDGFCDCSYCCSQTCHFQRVENCDPICVDGCFCD